MSITGISKVKITKYTFIDVSKFDNLKSSFKSSKDLNVLMNMSQPSSNKVNLSFTYSFVKNQQDSSFCKKITSKAVYTNVLSNNIEHNITLHIDRNKNPEVFTLYPNIQEERNIVLDEEVSWS